MNIDDRNFIHKCTSCQICASVCPKEAISINLNLDGFYRPYIDKDKCVNCGICKKVCYKFTDVPQYTADDAKIGSRRCSRWMAIKLNISQRIISSGLRC